MPSNAHLHHHSELGILLIAHGSRRAEANRDLVQLAEMLQRELPLAIIETAYLELAEPTIPQGTSRCLERGAKTVRLLPWFLSAGEHVKSDLRGYQQQFQREYSEVTFELCPPLGLHPLMVEMLMDRLGETLSD